MPRLLHAADLHLCLEDKEYGLSVFAALIGQLHGPEQGAFRHEGNDHHIGDIHQDLLFVLKLCHQSLGRGAGGHEDGFFKIPDELFFIGERRILAAAEIGDAHQFPGDGQGGSHDIEAALHGAFEDHVDGEQAIDLVSAFIDAVDPAVAIGLGDDVFVAVTVTAVDLYAFVHYEVQHFAAEYFEHRAFHGIFFSGAQHRFVKGFTLGGEFYFLIVDPFCRPV